MRADVHMHTSFSHDSKSAPEEMIQKSIEKGLEVICFTDHYDKDYLGWGEESVFDVEKYFKGKIWFRHVMVPGFTDNKESMDKFIEIIKPYRDKIERVEILPYHLMGVAKYKEIGRDYKLKGVPAMNKEKAVMLESYVRSKLNLN